MGNIKVDEQWRKLTGAWGKIDGEWRKIDNIQSKIDGVWRDTWKNAFPAPSFLSYPSDLMRGQSFIWTSEAIAGASYELQSRYNGGQWSSSSFISRPTGTFTLSESISNSTIQLRIRAVEPNTHIKESSWTEGPVRSLNAQSASKPSGLSYPSSITRGELIRINWNMLGDIKYTLQAVYNDGAYIATVHEGLGGSPKFYTVNTNTSYKNVYFRLKASMTGFNDSDWLIGPKITLKNQELDQVPSLSVPKPVSGATITVSWGAVKNAASYILEIQYNDGTWSRIYFGPNRSASYELREYTATAKTVRFRVRATATGFADGDWRTSSSYDLQLPPTKVSEWTAHLVKSWRSKEDWGWRDVIDTGGDAASVNYMYQGSWNEPPWWGNHRGLAWFNTDSMKKTLAGKDIISTQVYFYRINRGGYVSGQPITLYTHNYTGVPSGMPLLNYVQGPFSSFARGEGKWVTVSNTIISRILAGNARGIALYREDGQAYLYMSSNVKIKVTYR